MEEIIMEYLGQILLAIALALVEIARRKSKSEHEKELAEQKRITDKQLAEQKRISDDQNQEHVLKLQALQNENVHTNSQLEIIKEFAAGVPKNQESWQTVLNNMSARRLEGDKEIAGALRDIAQANRAYTQEIDEFGSILEIHTTTHGVLTKEIEDGLHTFVASAAATHKAVDSQKQELQLLIKSNDTLASRLDDLIAIDESHVIDEGARHEILRKDNSEHKAELVAIKNALLTGNGILENILKRIESNTQPLPLPTPETWHEDAEATALLPPNPHEDPKPVPPLTDSENKPPKVA